MRNLALTIAELISSPAAAPATQQALIAAWAYAESVNDYRLTCSWQEGASDEG